MIRPAEPLHSSTAVNPSASRQSKLCSGARVALSEHANGAAECLLMG